MRRYTRLGKDLRAARNAKGWSQEKFAGLLGCKRQRVILWEGGKHRPNLSYRDLVSSLLEAEFDWSADPEPKSEAQERASEIRDERHNLRQGMAA